MAQPQVHNGYNYYEQADGSWKRGEAVQQAPRQAGPPADPAFAFKGAQAEADARKSTAQATVADRTVEAQIALANAQAAAAQAEANKAIASGQGAGATTAQTEVDKKFAQEYVDWRAAGGYAGLERNLKGLDEAIAVLESSDNISGPIYGRLPKAIQQMVDPRGVDVKADVERVIQQSLKLILGGQFAMREADQLFAREYDPTQEEGSNIARIRSSRDQLRELAIAKESSAQYYEQNGTLTGWTGPTPEDRNAMTQLRIGGAGPQMRASGLSDVGGGGTTTDPLPPGYASDVDALTARLASEGGGRINPQAFIEARNALDREYGLPGTPPAELSEWANSVNEYLNAGGRTIPSGAMPASRLMTQAETMRNNLVNNPIGGALSGAGNTATFGAVEALLPDQYAAMGEAQGGSQFAGEIAGAIGTTAALGGAARAGASRLAPQLLQGGGRGQFARNVATDASYGAAFGGVAEGDPLTGAALGTAGSVAGQGAGRAISAGVGGAQISDAARRLRDRGVPISVGRQLGLGRAEDAMQSIPIVGDMSRARQLDSFQGLQMAAMREGGAPIGFDPTRAGREGLEDFGNARSQFYNNTLSGVDAPLDAQFAQDMTGVSQLAQGLSQANRRKLGGTLDDAMGMSLNSGSVTGREYQDALVALKRLRNNPGEAMPNAARTLQESATGSIAALDGVITRGSSSDVVEGLGKANQANRSFKTLEDAMNRAAGGSQSGEIFLPTPFQMQQAGLSTKNRYPGPRPFAGLADDAQTVLPSKLPNSGTTDRAIMAGILGTAGIGAGIGGGSGFAGSGEMQGAGDGAQTGAITGASLAAALALLGTRQGQKGLQRLMIDRPPAAMSLGQAMRHRGGLFGSAGGATALQGQ